MSKLYVFGIGGTGSRVLRSLTMLLASGVKCGVDTIVPIIIDRDKGNGDYSRTENLIKNYISVNKNIAPKNDPENKIKNRFFNTNIKLLGNEILLKLDDETKKFEDFIGLSTQTDANKALSKMLFSKDTLEMDTEYGFKGNPNIGSVVLNQFDDKNIFKTFASDFQEGDKIFIISSIFGGTGASGFPLLRKMLQTPNLKDEKGAELPNWGLINEAPIGAISVLPYFSVDKKDNIDSDTFNDKTRAALSYYETENGKLDTLYYIADTNRKAYKYAEGGKEQENDAHFVELAAAMSILDFVNIDKKFVNFQKDGNKNRRTIYKEFGINSDVNEISFDNLATETQKLIVNPLSRFMLFSKYMGYTIVKKSEDGKDKFIAERVSRYDIFDQQKKYQPFARGRFDGDFRNKITNLEYIQRQFVEWLQEMTQQSRKFSPFNLKTDDVFNFVKGNVSLFIKKHATYKNWAKVDNELNRQITKIDKSLENEKKFIELFYRATEELINQTSTNKGSEGDKYIFRLQNEGDFGLLNTIEHWDVSDIYGEKQRNAIKSSNKESENQPTSIPSPFARIALVKTAFAEVVAYGDGALRAYQKIVSDTLDVAEIFFTFDKWKDKIEIIKWDKVEDLKQLSEHKHFHKTLTVFLKNDAESYNFDEMKCLYILKFKATGEMIGATSPCTLFFSTANKLVDENGDFFIGTGKDKKTFGTIELSNNHRAFAEIYPLHKRSWDFQKYLYTWIKAKNKNWDNGNTPVSIYNEFVKYLNSEKELSGRIEEIDNLIDNFEDYDIFPAETPVEVCGNRLHKLRGFINVESLTVSDLMEDKIISLPYAIDSASFFDGNLINGKCYLLPLKEKFFELPESRDLKKQIRIEGGESTVNVILELSNNGSLKKFEKVYKRSEMTLVELSDYDCSIFPNVKFQEEKNAFYRVGLYLPYSAKEIESNIDFYQGTNKIILGEVDSIIRNINDSENVICKIYSLNQRTFDRMRVKIGDATGVLIPTLPEKQPNVVFTFAVDFGTTNTHIEYKTNIDNTIRPFDIKENEKQIQFLHGKIDENILVSDIDFIPKTIGQDKGFKFPVRTALSLSRNRERSQTILPFVQSNMIIPYEKRVVPKYNEVFTQLKWDSTEDEMGYYIDSLCFMLRNKVVLNDGNLSETKIVWFYPLSMAGSRSTVIRNKWKLAYLKYFLGISATSIHDLEINQNEILERNLIELPESIAPFLYYKYDRSYKDVINNLVSIDIGGGTTDIVFVEDGNTKYVTSFRFAANSVFGLGEQITSVVSKYQSDIENIILDENRSGGAKYNYLFDNIYRGIIGDTEKGDIASFFFALKNHERLQNIENDRIDFNAMLTRDSDQKLIFVLFYSAII